MQFFGKDELNYVRGTHNRQLKKGLVSDGDGLRNMKGPPPVYYLQSFPREKSIRWCDKLGELVNVNVNPPLQSNVEEIKEREFLKL